MMFDKTRDVAGNLFHPVQFMYLAASFIPATIYSLLVDLDFGTLLSPSRFKEAWFARFWSIFGPRVREHVSPAASPLIHLAHGVVLDIGPGAGEWVSHFDASKVTKIYGIEPNTGLHPRLLQKIIDAGLSSKYVIVPVGVEDFEEWTKSEKDWNGADSIVTVLCLCSIPDTKSVISGLYGLLNEGGSWMLMEHVKVKPGRWVGWYQSALNLIWPHFLGGCSLTKDTEKMLKQAGPWSKVNLAQPATEPTYAVLPHVKGVLVK